MSVPSEENGKLLSERRTWPTIGFGAHEIHAATMRLYAEQYGDWRDLNEQGIQQLKHTQSLCGEMLEGIEKHQQWTNKIKKERHWQKKTTEIE